MYERNVFKDSNQNHIPALIQEAANYLMQIGEDLSYGGRVLASIGDGLFAVGSDPTLFLKLIKACPTTAYRYFKTSIRR